jgi:hypothetical protein
MNEPLEGLRKTGLFCVARREKPGAISEEKT